ncbi:hypothetical protein BH10ACT3_BH10ACT3_16190 [soil metagenome]
MTTNADKHARQKERRDRLAEARRELDHKARRRRLLSIVGGVLGLIVVIGVVVLLTTGGDDETASSSTTVAEGGSTTSVPAAAAELPAPPPGATLTDATTCPPADGSAERVQVFAGPPPDCLTPGSCYTATFDTSEGSFTAELDTSAAPETVNNFVVLARYHYYDGVPFHRVVPTFVIQAGDGDGAPWGNNDLGYTIEDEMPETSAAYTDYSLAMANSGADTNGSQFFVVLPGGGAQLQPLYSSVCQVTEGQEVVDAIGARGDAASPDGAPTKTVLINTITIKESAG